GILNGSTVMPINLSHITTLLDGTKIDPKSIYGTVSIGPYPFEADESAFAYKRFRQGATLQNGRSVLDVGVFFETKYNSEGWTDNGKIVVRFNLFMETTGPDRYLGRYDVFFAFKKDGNTYTRLPWIQEGPFVNTIDSRNPEKIVLTFVTDFPTEATLLLDDGCAISAPKARDHEITLDNLSPATSYTYRVKVGDLVTRLYSFRTAPVAGEGSVIFAYCGDSREGVGGALENYMGVNYNTLEKLAGLIYAKKAEFFLFGGDLINGYTTDPVDFYGQLYAWKQAVSGYWHERPVYPGMGNHDALLRAYRTDKSTVRLDRWPYETQSAEALFARAFANPTNGPDPSDPRRPSYKENVYTLHYGPVKIIAFNNNYWYSNAAGTYGGCPEGYILEDQMQWIEAQIQEAEQDPTVRFVLLYAQEPVFPCGGHAGDAMWYQGNNNIRAYTYRNGTLTPEALGIIDVRNRLVRAAAQSTKVAAVLGGDEHAYYRLRVDQDTPVGNPDTDDRNGDKVIDWKNKETATALADLKYPTWYITSGGGGAPYYADENMPWNLHWKARPNVRENYLYSSQENVILFTADASHIEMRVYNPYGELIDEIGDLMAIRNTK
ncbi:MAG: metallophosphoesterase, partial [bacterium]|nr:metallophosphoesterase [bacterium]